jgi:hypothetical protein
VRFASESSSGGHHRGCALSANADALDIHHAAPWIPSAPKVLSAKTPTLDNQCTLSCTWGGVILVVARRIYGVGGVICWKRTTCRKTARAVERRGQRPTSKRAFFDPTFRNHVSQLY